jgi:hypothetical protein
VNRLFVIAALLCSTNAYAQKGVVFTASTSQNSTYMDSSTGTLLPTLTSYKIQFTKGEATVKTVDIGKPTPDASNNITYLDSTLFYCWPTAVDVVHADGPWPSALVGHRAQRQ